MKGVALYQRRKRRSRADAVCLLIAVLWTFLLHASPSKAQDALEFIVRNNPELRELCRYNENAFSRLRIRARASFGTGAGTIGADGVFSQGDYDARIIAEMPLFSPRERLEMRMNEFGFRRQLRSEASRALSRYRKLRRWLKREKSILKDLRLELYWLKRRAEAGIEPQKVIMEKALALKERERNLSARQEELKDALEAVLSFVPKQKRRKLKRLIKE
ncbi:hypothetical protein DBT_1827 [Dissulfuribacter thermophilus]|uniref:Heavy metal RND efflux outer membrane protein, CzcC family n=1 Tax=Dissulfuribacter thermophilus TaxID=1156395 RepID=A0A1B9F492_9BACT|nr:hypothetical protein [Dissulfuribacter thermophilus]OCC14767.1 hypothetical protein DBT_1827 [Dissulfuribacter thermophilus]